MWLGTVDNARRALEVQDEFVKARLEFGPRELQYTDMLDPDDPVEWWSSQVDEWICLGAGGSRVAWLCPDDGIVYKVPLGCHEGANSYCCTNQHEWRRYKQIIHLSAEGLPVRIPKTSMVTVDRVHVLAMEHIVGDFAWDMTEAERKEITVLIDSYDVHAWNVLITADGTKVVVDFVA